MSSPELRTSRDPGTVWRVGFWPDPWRWSSWEYARDAGRFNGRWDDEWAEFRTIYTSESLLGCFLELLAPLRPNTTALEELARIQDDGGQAAVYPDPQLGAVGMDWLSGRCYASAVQGGVYAEVTAAASVGYLRAAGVFTWLGIPERLVDVALLKEPDQRRVTRSVARFLFDQHDGDGRPLVDGIAFRSRLGDDIRMWAVFERDESAISPLLEPEGEPAQVTEDQAELVAALGILGLHWGA